MDQDADRPSGDAPAPGAAPAPVVHRIEQCAVPAGPFLMGDASGDRIPGDGETPRHEVVLSAFTVDATTVTNDDFARFTDATGYRTEAEVLGVSAVFHLAVAAPEGELLPAVTTSPWWRGVRGASWRRPGGSRSDLEGLGDHPVVHMSWHDARAYCAWAGRRLPTEAEWEAAARGGLEGARFPWGDEDVEQRPWRANTWQSHLEGEHGGGTGRVLTVPAHHYAPNGLGLRQCVGNVWEWCEDRFHPATYRRGVGAAERRPVVDPVGPAEGPERVLRGGSHLCHSSSCTRYRVAARSRNTPDSSAGNTGFRTVSPRGPES